MRNGLSLSFSGVNRLVEFLESFGVTTEVEELSVLHTHITEKVFGEISQQCTPSEYPNILDIGCGSGVALKIFYEKGYSPIGITINPKEVEICKAKGYDVRLMDQSFLEFEDNKFNIIWARHVLEHSIMPYFTLLELKRVLSDDGFIYVEVPAPDTVFNHQNNPFHFSTLTKSLWIALMNQAGFNIIRQFDIPIVNDEIPDGDIYWSFILKKK